MTDAPPPVTDTPATVRQEWPKPSKWEVFKTVYGDMARPTAIYLVALATAYAVVAIASRKAPDWSAAAIFIGAVFSGLAVIYGVKSAENYGQARETAKTEVAKAQAQTTVTTAP